MLLLSNIDLTISCLENKMRKFFVVMANVVTLQISYSLTVYFTAIRNVVAKDMNTRGGICGVTLCNL